jgi:hypothetical protein
VVRAAAAATIEVTPSDSYTKLEGIKAGDEVVIAPGTYRFRVHLTTAAPANNPVRIHAKDAQNPPVWDLGASNVEDARGSYTAGDRGRGCWQLNGATNIHISDIAITGCHNADHNSAGIRYYNTSTGIKLTNILLHDNDNGLTGGSERSEVVVEFCEFARNGNLQASAPSHNIYVYGGTFALRYSYVHDPIQAQNFHIRARDSTIEYNWFSRAKSYAGDLMTDDDVSDSALVTQTMTLRGNVIVQGATQSNNSQIIAVYNDGGASNLRLAVKLLYNTFVGNGGHAALVHLSNADGTPMSADLSNNIVFGTNTPVLVEDSAHATVTGSNNWLVTGATAPGLAGSVFGSDPGFKNAAQDDYTLATGGQAIGAALDSISGAPLSEYYRDETVKRSYRQRLSAKDIGAFESTTQGPGIGPNGVGTGGAAATGGAPGGGASSGGASSGGAPTVGGSSQVSTATGGRMTGDPTGGAYPGSSTATPGGTSQTSATEMPTLGGGGAAAPDSSGSCGCAVPGRSSGSVAGALTIAMLAILVRVRRTVADPGAQSLAREREMARRAHEHLMYCARVEAKAEGRAEGEARGEAKSVLAVLEARGIAVTEAQRERILQCPDLERLSTWVRKAVTLGDVNELFAE